MNDENLFNEVEIENEVSLTDEVSLVDLSEVSSESNLVDLSEVDTKEEIEEVLEDLAEIEDELEANVTNVTFSNGSKIELDGKDDSDKIIAVDNVKEELVESDELVIPSELRSDSDKSSFYKNHAKENGLHYLGISDGKPVFKEIK